MTYLYEALKEPTRLYIKQCPHCGMKYFGKSVSKTIENYRGSGKHWTRHLNKHKVDPIHLWNSEWYYDTSITRFALRFSRMNKIVKSNEWANLMEENGVDGGWSHVNSSTETATKRSKTMMGKNNHFYGKTHSEDVKMLLSELASQQWTGVPKSEEHKKKIAKSNSGKVFTEERRKKISIATTGRVPYNKRLTEPKFLCSVCGKVVAGKGNLARWHEDNCKEKS